MRRTTIVFYLVIAVALIGAPAWAQSSGSFAGAFSNAYLIPTTVCQAGTTSLGSTGDLTCSGGVSTPSLLAADIKLPNGSSDKTILAMASLETAITTDTLVASKNGTKSTSTANGSIVVTPTLCTSDGTTCNLAPIYPSEVTFYSQTQTLSADLLGLGCTADTTGTVSCTSPETIELILSITGAHSFNFLVDNSALGAGVYQLRFGVGVTTSASTNSLPAGATVDVAVAAGSLGALVVQAQTPFNTISLCDPTNTVSGTTNNCGP
jgi:hypothetical protein